MTKLDFMIQVFEPKLTRKDRKAVLSAVKNNLISGTSPLINEFENKLAESFDRKYAVALSNGTVALEMSLRLLNLKEEDEVILPSFTIISCLAAVLRAGAKPVFCDVSLDSWNMTLDNVKEVTTEKTKAVLMVHTYGLTAEASEIEMFCKDNNIFLVEDSAEAHGQVYQNRKCGSFGDVSTLSFYANKHITTGEGGAVLTDNKNFYETLKQMINLDFKEPNRFNHDNFYWNYRMSSLQAALGISQIKNLNNVINLKMKQGQFYNYLFKNHENFVKTPLLLNNQTSNHFWVYGLVLKSKINREILKKFLSSKNIEVRDFFWPLHLQKALNSKFHLDHLNNSEYIGKQGIYLPIGSHINKKLQNFISEMVLEGCSHQII